MDGGEELQFKCWKDTHYLTMGTERKLQILEELLEVVMDGFTLKEHAEKRELLLG